MNTNSVNSKTQESGADNSASIPAIDLLTAWNLVAIGNLDDAEHLLRKSGKLPLSLSALDLLARIAVQKGQYEQARQLWRAVLEKDSSHEAAKAAIKRLGSPWIAVALIKRAAILASFAVILCLSIVGLFALFNVVEESQLRPAAPVFSVPGCLVYANQAETRIVFEDGLFTFRCRLKESAKERLATFTRILREKAPNYWIIVEGHSDSFPMRKNGLYKDNYALGLQRALTVAEVLKLHHQIAGGRILVMSMGDRNPPFPEVDYKSKLKNRTVVIRLFDSSVQ
jgi:outer membrane protein OmpA-like peptidoglycan-associated protein